MFVHKFVVVLLVNISLATISTAAYHNHRHTNNFVTRDTWMAVNASGAVPELNLPVGRVIIAHTVTLGCETELACSTRIRSIQNYHMNTKHWVDIGYNFLIGGDGRIYVGRGWNKLGTHTVGHNANSIGVGIIGTFTHHFPSRKQLSALKYLIEKGVHMNKLDPNYVIYPHRALTDTDSPGDKVVESIENWSHYYMRSNVPEMYARMGDVADDKK